MLACFLLIVVKEMILGSVERPLYFYLFKQQTFCPLLSECQTLLLVLETQRRWRQAHSGFLHCFFVSLNHLLPTYLCGILWWFVQVFSLATSSRKAFLTTEAQKRDSFSCSLLCLISLHSPPWRCYISTYLLICFHLLHQNWKSVKAGV